MKTIGIPYKLDHKGYKRYLKPMLVQFFNHMYLQKIKVDVLDKAVPAETSSGNAFEFCNIGIQPDWLAQIQLLADSFQCLKDHRRSGHGVVGVFDYVIV